MVRARLCTHLVMKHLMFQNMMVDPLEFLSGFRGTGMIMTSQRAVQRAGLERLHEMSVELLEMLKSNIPEKTGEKSGWKIEKAHSILHKVCL